MSNFVLNDDTIECEFCYESIGVGNEADPGRLVMGTTTLPCGRCGPEHPATKTVPYDEPMVWPEHWGPEWSTNDPKR